MTAVKRFEFEVIATAIPLPDTNDFQLVDFIRQTPKNKDTAIFVISSDTDTMNAGEDDTVAVTAYFDKADGHESLVKFILNFLDTYNELPANVLYVDKSATSTAITTGILERNEIGYTHFSDAAATIEFLKQGLAEGSGSRFDVMITDLTLGDSMSGYELIQTVRNELNLDYRALPVLLMTIEPGEDERTDFTAIFGAGTNDFITKPVNENDLLSRLRTLVSIKRQNEALNPLK